MPGLASISGSQARRIARGEADQARVVGDLDGAAVGRGSRSGR